jgi:hypothetical protein
MYYQASINRADRTSRLACPSPSNARVASRDCSRIRRKSVQGSSRSSQAGGCTRLMVQRRSARPVAKLQTKKFDIGNKWPPKEVLLRVQRRTRMTLVWQLLHNTTRRRINALVRISPYVNPFWIIPSSLSQITDGSYRAR